MDKYHVLKKLQELKPTLRAKYGVSELALFGSYSRNEQTVQSDIDIMVDFERPVGVEFLDVVYLLRNAFEPTAVQVVSRGGIRPKYFQHVSKDLIYA